MFLAACKQGFINIVRKVAACDGVTMGAGARTTNMGLTPLHLACRNNRKIDVIKYLLDEMDGDVNKGDELCRTPLMHAAAAGKFEFVACVGRALL